MWLQWSNTQFNIKPKMELGEAIFGLLALACFIVPVIYLQRRGKQEKKRFLKDFLQLAQQQELNLSMHDFWNHSYAIGLDSVKNKLFYLKKREGVEQKVVFDLAEIETCRFINANRTINGSRVTDRLSLEFAFLKSGLPVKILEFYTKEESMAVHDEIELAEKWMNLISSHLEVKRKLSLAS